MFRLCQPQHHKDEHALVPPPLPAAIKGCRRAKFCRCAPPAQPIVIFNNNANTNAENIKMRPAVALWKSWRTRTWPRGLFSRQMAEAEPLARD